jgi:hypothetical protein
MIVSSGPRRRPFILPLIGLTFLFASLGPLIGGLLFLPLFLALVAEPIAAILVPFAWLGVWFGHAVLLVAAYVFGLWPAMATGFLYAFWDRFAPSAWPRWLAAAAIGAVTTIACVNGFASLFDAAPKPSENPTVMDPSLLAALRHAIAACGAIAAALSALAAKGIGLSASKVVDPYSP